MLVGASLPAVSTPAASATSGRAADGAGAPAIGSASYPVPSGAVFVSPGGSDMAAGTSSAPVRSLARAVALAPAGGTVVMRGGQYNQSVVVSKPVTIQNFPGEQVWLDGTVPVTGWVKDGTRWRKDGWTGHFDHSPTYTRGAPDNTAPDYQFVNPKTAPMAAHPDQVWIGGRAQRQVGSLSQVTAGTFYLDESSQRLYLGSDPGAGQVVASNLAQAMSVRAPNVTVRGIGIRRYAPSVWMLGGVVLEQSGAVMENVRISEMATTGVSVLGKNVTLRKVTLEISGMLGLHGRFADGLRLDRVLSRRNNSEFFNLAPVSGGGKLTQTRGVTVRDSNFLDNYGHGFWQDWSTYDSVYRGSNFVGNAGNGLFLEISAKVVVGDSLFAGNDLDGVKVNNTSNVAIWNNTFVANGRQLDLVQDARRNTNPNDPAVDPRISWPDPAMPWQTDSVTVSNNVVGPVGKKATCLLCVEDYSKKESAESMKITANGNVYNRASSSAPKWLVVWSKGAPNPGVHTTLAGFKATTGQEARGREYTGRSAVSSAGVLATDVQRSGAQIGLALPGAVAGAIGRTAGTVRLGVWNDSSVTPPAPGPTPTPTPAPPGGTKPTTLAKDGFARTLGSGWGTAESGGSWTVPASASSFSVAGGAGRISLKPNDGFEARLDGVSSARTDLTLALAADQNSGVVGHWIDLVGRRVAGQGEYRGKLQLAPGSPVKVWVLRTKDGARTGIANAAVSGLTYRAGDVLKVRLQVVGTGSTALRMKVWKSGAAEPGAWTLTGTDNTAELQRAGSIGLFAYTGGSARGGPVRISVDQLQAQTIA